MTYGREEAAAEQGAGTAVACAIANSKRGGSPQSREDSGKDERDHAGCDHCSEQLEILLVVGWQV